MLPLGKLVKERREFLKITQDELAHLMGYKNRSSITKLEKGENDIPQSKLAQLAKALKTTPEYLIGTSSPPPETIELKEQPPDPLHPSEKGVRVPVLGYVAAGVPIEAIEDIIGYEEIPADWIKSRDVFFGLVVRGASMYPNFMDGDIAIIKQTPTVESGEIAVVQLANLDVTLKKIKREPNGIWLIGYNKDVYPPRFFTNEEIQNLPITILGKMVELRRKLE